MKSSVRAWICVWLFGAAPTFVHGSSAGGPAPVGFDLAEVSEVVVADDADRYERGVANLLAETLRNGYGARANIVTEPRCGQCIFVGRAAWIWEKVTADQLAALEDDGYLMRVQSRAAVLTGRETPGTIYAVYEFLRQIGLRFYPWQYGGGLQVFQGIDSGRLSQLELVDSPAFVFRDVRPDLDQGRNGGSIRAYSLGDFRFANDDPEFERGGFINWDHTSGWLVPRHRYPDNPEYFADVGHRNPLAAIPTHRSAVCMCEAEVTRIAGDRALEWISRQAGRRWFAITDGDASRPRCLQCESNDPMPDYYTDRLLGWVNAVARRVAARWPDKKLITLAYQATVKPPVAVAPDSEVTIVYSPWFWNSRATSAVGYNHPLNIVAARELQSWVERFPSQVGATDYPGNWVFGTAERIRHLHAQGVRWMYLNAPRTDLQRWISLRLLWNPNLDLDALIREFTDAYYGPAASAFRRYLELRRAIIAERSLESLDFFADREYIRLASEQLSVVEQLAAGTELTTQTRIFQGFAEGLESVLAGMQSLGLAGVTEVAGKWIDAQARVATNLKRLNVPRHAQNWHANNVAWSLRRLVAEPSRVKSANLEGLLRTAGREFVDDDSKQRLSQKSNPARRLEFASTASHWRADGFGLPVSITDATVSTAIRGDLRGVAVRAGLAAAPTGTRAARTAHFGRAHADYRFEKRMPIDHADGVYLHLYATESVPVTIYLFVDRRMYRSDVEIQAGEQIVRVLASSFDAGRAQAVRNDSNLIGLAVDIWPQDLIYPYPAARDVTLTVAAIELRSDTPSPDWLPYRGRAIWMTSFRPNLTHGDDALLRAAAASRAQGVGVAQLAGDYRRARSEAFRSFTEHRTLTPLQRILVPPGLATAANSVADELARRYGVRLPIENLGAAPTAPKNANAIVIRPQPDTRARVTSYAGTVWLNASHANGAEARVTELLELESAGRGDSQRLAFVHEWLLTSPLKGLGVITGMQAANAASP